MAASELRRDLITRRWVVVAKNRGKKPSDFSKKQEKKTRVCPFCPGNEKETPPEITSYNEGGLWKIRVVSNKFGAFSIDDKELLKEKKGVLRWINGRGAHEVIICGPKHDRRIYEFSVDEMNDLLWMCKERSLDLKKDPLIESVFIFGNEGEAAGASLEHPHWQLVGLPVVPKIIQEEIESCREYWESEDSCAFCLLTRQEKEDKSRLVSENDNFFVISYFASRVAFETWVLPNDHRPLFEDGGSRLIRSLAEILRDTLRRIGAVLDYPDFNIYFHSAPLQNRTHDRYYHFHIEIIPILTKVAGFEWGTGFYISPAIPEESADFLRKVKV